MKEIETGLAHATSAPIKVEGLSPSPGETDRRSESNPDGGEDMDGRVHIDGFLQPIRMKLGRGRDVKERRRSSTGLRKTSKRRRLGKDAEQQLDSAE